MTGKDESFRLSLQTPGEPQSEHSTSSSGQRYLSPSARVRLRPSDNQFASRDLSILPFEVQVFAAKHPSFACTQTCIQAEDEQRKQRRTSARSTCGVEPLLWN